MWTLWVNSTGSHSSDATTTGISCRSSSFYTATLKDLIRDDYHKPPSAALCRVLHRIRFTSSAIVVLRSASYDPSANPLDHRRRGLVLYFTSLRVVRRTYEDCRTVRSILAGLRVIVDERDLSMDSRFVTELQAAVGCRLPSIPQVFLAGRCLGGADEIRRLSESGELKALVEALPALSRVASACGVCGGVRFVLCRACDGSHKRYSEKGRRFRTCGGCNSNGLVRCPSCCPTLF